MVKTIEKELKDAKEREKEVNIFILFIIYIFI